MKLVLTDWQLARRVAKADADAFMELFARYEGEATAWGYRIGRTDDNMQEIVQCIRIRLWKSAKQFQGKSSFSSWFYTICRAEALMWWRREQKHRALLYVGLPNSKNPFFCDLAPHRERHDARLSAQSAISYINARHWRFRGDERAVLRLHGLDFTVPDCAKELGLTIAAVKSLMHRSRLRLRGRHFEAIREAVNY